MMDGCMVNYPHALSEQKLIDIIKWKVEKCGRDKFWMKNNHSIFFRYTENVTLEGVIDLNQTK